MQHRSPIPHDLVALHHPHMRLLMHSTDSLDDLRGLLCLPPPLFIQLVEIRERCAPTRHLILWVEDVLQASFLGTLEPLREVTIGGLTATQVLGLMMGPNFRVSLCISRRGDDLGFA